MLEGLQIEPEDVVGVGPGVYRAGKAGLGHLAGHARAGAEALAAGKGIWAAVGKAILHEAPAAESAGVGASKALDFSQMGNLTDQEVIDAIKNQPLKGTRVPPQTGGDPYAGTSRGANPVDAGEFQTPPEPPSRIPPNLTQESGLEATARGEGPAGSSNQGITRTTTLREPPPSNGPNPSNVQRIRSLQDEEKWLQAEGKNPRQAFHEAEGAQRKGVSASKLGLGRLGSNQGESVDDLKKILEQLLRTR
jgi:hypothetical protein